MKEIILMAAVLLFASAADAQLVRQSRDLKKGQPDLDWYNCSFEKDGVYGAEVNRAYEFLKGKKMKRRPVIALLSSGMDIEHEDLRQAVWRNPKERPDGKDNDRNGLTDDVHGWNFLGGRNGEVMDRTMGEGDREFLRLKDRYADYIFNGHAYFKIVDGRMKQVPAPEDMEEYRYFRNRVLMESPLASAYGGWQLTYVIRDYAHRFDSLMKARFPGRELTQAEFGICYDPKAVRDSLSEVSYMVCAMAFGTCKTDKWEVVYEGIRSGEQIELARMGYEEKYRKSLIGERERIVGDNPRDISDRAYGNHVMLTSDAATATMMAGIIAADRSEGTGIAGIMDRAEIMTLRVAGSGDPYLKDVALAVRYAVSHKADVVVLPEQRTLYPAGQREWLDEALEYAEKEGVLVIVPVREMSRNLSDYAYYPNRRTASGKVLENLMLVGASDKAGNPSFRSNYSPSELDIFAPGMEICSAYPGDLYQMGSGVALSAAAVAGVAAMIRAYFPKLTGSQIRNILLENVTDRKGVEVEKGMLVKGEPSQDLMLFGDLCISGGILNAYKAVKAAAAR